MKHLFLTLFLTISCIALAHKQDSIRIDLSQQWFKYDRQGEKQYSITNKDTKAHLLVDHVKFKGGTIVIDVNKETALFINGAIDTMLVAGGRVIIEVTNTINMITLYAKGGIDEVKSTLVYPASGLISEEVITERKPAHLFNFVITALLITLGWYGYNKSRSSELLNNHFKLARALSMRTINETLFKIRLLEKSNLQMLVAHALGIAMVIIVLINWRNTRTALTEWLVFDNYLQAMLMWGILSLVVLTTLLFKSVLISVFTALLKLTAFRRIHFYTYLRITLFIYIFWFILSLFFIYQLPTYNASGVVVLIGLLLMVLRVLVIFIKLMSLERYRIFYLFSYLCATEILPYIFLVKTTYI